MMKKTSVQIIVRTAAGQWEEEIDPDEIESKPPSIAYIAREWMGECDVTLIEERFLSVSEERKAKKCASYIFQVNPARVHCLYMQKGGRQ